MHAKPRVCTGVVPSLLVCGGIGVVEKGARRRECGDEALAKDVDRSYKFHNNISGALGEPVVS